MIAFLVIASLVVGATVGFYIGVIFQHKNDLAQARAEIAEEYNQMCIEHGITLTKADGFEWELERAHIRIKQLESIAALPLQRMPTGSLVHGYNKKQEAEKIDLTPTEILNTDLPPMQVL